MRVLQFGKPLPPAVEESNRMFKGAVHMRELVGPPESEIVRVLEVTFRPGGRTRWHTHSTDQYLFVTNGHGFVGNEEGDVPIRTGDLVFIPANERHWHGASEDSEMTHMAIMTPCENVIEDD